MKKILITVMLLGFTYMFGQTIVPIGDIQNNLDDYLDQEVVIRGVVTIGDDLLYSGKTQFYLQDNSGRGIQIFEHTPLPYTYVKGDSIEVTGVVDLYTGSSGNNYDVQITDPEVTLISSGNPMPAFYDIAGGEDTYMNGTWSRAVGVITGIWDSPYGFYQITVSVNGYEIDLQYWDSTGADVSQYEEDDMVAAFGVIAFYQGNAQLSCAYEDDISIFSGNLDTVVENVTFGVAVEDSLAVSFNISQAEGSIGEINLFYSYDYEDVSFGVELIESGANPTTYSGTIPGGESGLTINLSVYIEFADGHVIQELNFDSYTFPVENHKAILQVPAKPFDPVVGATIPIKYCSKEDDKAILRIYNAEGKLVRTAKNEVIEALDGINYFNWDGRDKNGNLCPIGLYFVHLQVIEASGGKSKTNTVPIVIGTPLN